ncbi:hypothetical protein [Paraburkholderia youngii]|uniref:hypothetical protein n=1 Tax=Paraburkholderia youngii TaxID=2782701 RepID=UPI003D257036
MGFPSFQCKGGEARSVTDFVQIPKVREFFVLSQARAARVILGTKKRVRRFSVKNPVWRERDGRICVEMIYGVDARRSVMTEFHLSVFI